jgi:hypothetical protein
MIFKHPSHVPEPPDTSLWLDDLRWAVTVMDDDDDALAFVTSVLSYCVENNGITKKQGEAAGRIIKRLKREFLAGVLACQIPVDNDEATSTTSQEVRTLQ